MNNFFYSGIMKLSKLNKKIFSDILNNKFKKKKVKKISIVNTVLFVMVVTMQSIVTYKEIKYYINIYIH